MVTQNNHSMKKLLLSLAMLAGIGIAQAENLTLVMADQWGTTDADLTEWTQQGVTFTPSSGQNPTGKIPVYKKKNKEVRFYALNTITISVPATESPITQLVFTLSSQGVDEQAVITASTGDIAPQAVGNSTVTWTGSTREVTLTVGAANELHPVGIVDGSGQFDFTKVEVATGESTISKPIDTETTLYMCNASDANGILSNWTQGNISFSASKGADETANDPALKNAEEARLYVGNTLTIKTVNGNNLESVEFILSEQGLQQQAALAVNTGTMTQSQGTNPKWNGLANEITLTVGANEFGTNATKKGQFDFLQINIAYHNTTAIVEEIHLNNNPVEYFTIDGTKVSQPTSGLYIVRQGNSVSKIVL